MAVQRFLVRFIVLVDQPGEGQVAFTAAKTAMEGAGVEVVASDSSRIDPDWRVLGVDPNTLERWSWRGIAQDAASAEAVALLEHPGSLVARTVPVSE